jgi:levansucrase
LAGIDLWDMWPLALRDGATACVAGGTLWFALSAPQMPDPVDRHGLARIRLLHQAGETWRDCGNALPDGFSPGSREWAGSALLDAASGRVTLFFTAAGRRDESRLTFEQRLVKSTGLLDLAGDTPAIAGWSPVRECVASDGCDYVIANQAEGSPGTIKAFRDPAYFHDRFDGVDYLLFAASLGQSKHDFNGCVGVARASGDLESWSLLPPLLTADGVNNELERPHVVFHAGCHYLFWSTQTHTFAPGVAAGPNGLYGAVAPAFLGPYEPLNGSGLVCANPPSEPMQSYSWWVQGDCSVVSFIDYWGMAGRSLKDHPELRRSQFGGVPAPTFKLRLSGREAFLF